MATFLEQLSDWTDFDVAEYQLGLALGIFDPDRDEFPKVKVVFWSSSLLGRSLYEILVGLVHAGILERAEGQFRRNQNFDGDPVFFSRVGTSPAERPSTDDRRPTTGPPGPRGPGGPEPRSDRRLTTDDRRLGLLAPGGREALIRERLARATPGSWSFEPHGSCRQCDGAGCTWCQGSGTEWALYADRTDSGHGLNLVNLSEWDHNGDANRALIAAAPSDLGYLLVRVSALEGECDGLVRRIEDLREIWGRHGFADRLDAASLVVDRLVRGRILTHEPVTATLRDLLAAGREAGALISAATCGLDLVDPQATPRPISEPSARAAPTLPPDSDLCLPAGPEDFGGTDEDSHYCATRQGLGEKE